MTESITVALLFDDEPFGEHVRDALRERGAAIIHESAVAALDRELIEQLAPDVLVVSLDDSLASELDALYALIDGGFTRVIFNDAQASRGLKGWDRARWARHLAAKVLDQGDIDPPRPEAASANVDAPDQEYSLPFITACDHELERDRQTSAEAEALAAELESLLASEPTMPDDGVRNHDFDRMHRADGQVAHPAGEESISATLASDAASASADEDPATPMPPESPGQSDAASSSATRLHESWSLLDVEETPAAPAEDEHFGIEKLSAADYLAPPADPMSPTEELRMSLELVSLEASVAPQFYQGEAGSNHAASTDLGCVVLLGAAVSSGDSIKRFMSALPAQLRCAFVLVQHHGGRGSAELVQDLAQYCALPMRMASVDRQARPGELLVVPSGEQLTLLRDGSVDLQPCVSGDKGTPSIDATFSLVAKVFGGDALAIVFAGRATDALGGCQAVHDRGGRVWVEPARDDDFADMVNGILAERLATFVAPPHELAARLIEEYR